jgi:hypothetical protein
VAERATDRLLRLLGMVTYLDRHGGVPIEQVAEHFGVSTRQVVQDIDTLWVTGTPGYWPHDLIDFDAASYDEGVLRLVESRGMTRPLRLGTREAVALIAALRAMREALIPAQATMAEPDYAAAFRTLATRHRKRSLVVLFTDVIDPRSSQAVIAHTTRGAARHLPLVVALRNDALASAALPAGRATPAALFESAAAEELLSSRDEALARMRQAGVSVVDVSPHAMTAAVVNRYLEIKARAGL